MNKTNLNNSLRNKKNGLNGKMKVKAEMTTKQVELTDEDIMNVKKWITAVSIMVEAKVRTPMSDSEHATYEKLTR